MYRSASSHGVPRSMLAERLCTALDEAFLKQIRIILGDILYPLVDKLEHEHAAKVTDMLLESDRREIFHLIGSPDALKAKVSKVMDVVKNAGLAQQEKAPELLPNIPRSKLAQSLCDAVDASCIKQIRNILGETLYPLVDQLEHRHASKVTGMLLELDRSKIFHLIDSPHALKAKVSEAMNILMNAGVAQQGNI